MNSAMGFASTLFGKLDMFRESYGFQPSTMNAYAAYTKAPYLKAPPPVAVNPWSFYMLGNGGVSERQSTVAANGFNLDSVGGTIGTEYRINNNAFVGGAFDYSNPKARLFNNAGTTDVNSYQLGIYGAWADAHFFAQGLATFGWQNFRNTRPGVVADLRPGKSERLHRIRRSSADIDGRPADRGSADRKRRRAIPHPVHGQWQDHQPLSQSDG